MWWHYLTRFRRSAAPPRAAAPNLPLLEHVSDLEPARWLRESMTTFAQSVASLIPGEFESYARIHHPFEYHDATGRVRSWREGSELAGVDLTDPAAAEAFAERGVNGEQARVGTLHETLIGPLVEHLGAATSTPGECFFAIWEGFAASAVPSGLEPRLELPERRYHLFRGSIEAARTSFSDSPYLGQSANLWWPADHAWCVATEVDLAWSYVGGARPLVRALLADPRLDGVETTAAARW